jgi:hypothetical protein
MSRLWRDFRTNLMYWRFRHVTRNRLRLQSWIRRRQPGSPVRARGTAAYVYHRSGRKTWILLVVMVALLTLLKVAPRYVALNGSLAWGLGTLVVVGAIYWALRGK